MIVSKIESNSLVNSCFSFGTLPGSSANNSLSLKLFNSDKVDFYFVAGAGYKNRSWKYDSTDPDYESTTVSGTLIPVAARIGIGTRFWFTDNIGANVDLGFGHSGLLNAGLSFKF